MKKILLGLVATVMLSVAGNAQDLSKLSQDVNFKLYLKNQFEFTKKATDINKVKELLSDGKIDESEINAFYRAFSTNEANFSTYIKVQNNLYTSLNEVYNLDEVNQDVLIPIIEDVYITDLIQVLERSTCRQKYVRAITTAAAAAVIGHGGCIALDPTVLGGILCHGAVAVLQWNAGQDALDAYHECIRG